MRVLVPAVRGMLHPSVIPAIERVGVEPEVWWLSTDTGYAELLADAWAGGDDLCVVEQDVEVRLATLRSFELCPQPWCTGPYMVHGGRGRPMLVDGLGCVRWRRGLLDMVAPPRLVHWANVESEIVTRLRRVGHRPHRHAEVRHHHAY